MTSTKTFLLVYLFLTVNLFAQSPIFYEISFDNAVHHEAEISIEYRHVSSDTLSIRMSRTSPGRYAVHEFAKNVYGFKAFDDHNNALKISRPNPHQWDITGHKGVVKVTYTLFANHGDGTYSQVDESHAHLNVPATFMYAPDLIDHPIQVKIITRNDLNWKIATQLKNLGSNEFFAPHLNYFMDSPIEISNHEIRSFKVSSEGKEYDINFVLHQAEEYNGFDDYFEKVKKIVRSQMNVFGGLPEFDYDNYTFLACYLNNVDGDGMEHRNSTILTDKTSLSKGGDKENIGTVAHEFFHAWNVERIRPLSLEPFDYTDANMSGELWFAEGFTSYYTGLTLCRTGIISRENYVSSLSRGLNYVWNSPGRSFFSPIEMSYQAPFVDAATSVDETNRENTFISYYTYGSVLGLALDLSLRNLDTKKNLDGFMRKAWAVYGKKELPYTIKNLETLLADYAGKSFSQEFFNNYIYKSNMPDYASLLASVGIDLKDKYSNKPSFGASIKQKDNKWIIDSNPHINTSLYRAGMAKGDRIVSIDGKLTNNNNKPVDFLESYKVGDVVKVVFNRYEQQLETRLEFTKDASHVTELIESVSKEVKQRQNSWLKDNTE